MKLSGTIGVTQKTMTLDTHVRLILLQTLNPQERWGTHKKRWPFQPRLFADVIGLVRCSYDSPQFSLVFVAIFSAAENVPARAAAGRSVQRYVEIQTAGKSWPWNFFLLADSLILKDLDLNNISMKAEMLKLTRRSFMERCENIRLQVMTLLK